MRPLFAANENCLIIGQERDALRGNGRIHDFAKSVTGHGKHVLRLVGVGVVFETNVVIAWLGQPTAEYEPAVIDLEFALLFIGNFQSRGSAAARAR